MNRTPETDAGKSDPGRRRRRWWLTLIVLALAIVSAWLLAGGVRRSITNGAAVKCASHLRNIGIAIGKYAAVHNGDYPADLSTLYLHSTTEARRPEIYVCPGTDERAATGAAPHVVARNIVHGHVSYLYVGGGLRSDAGDDVVLALDLPSNHDHFVQVLFADGTAHHLSHEQAKPLVAQAMAGIRPVRRVDVAAGAPTALE